MKLEGSKIVVIGGTSGIGLAIARAGLERGAEVVVAGRSEEKLARAAGELGGRAEARRLDATAEEEVRGFFAELAELDHLVVTAGAGASGPFFDLDLADARAVLDGKFWAQYAVARHGAPRLRERGSLTLTSGVASVKPVAGLAAVAAANGAIEALGRHLAVELAPRRVNVVSPGMVETPVYDRMPEPERRAMFEAVGKSLPAGRVGQPEDIASAVAYLWESPFATGEVLYPDGGYRLA